MKNRRIVITKKGGPEVLELIEEDIADPGDGEVLVKVIASGVAFGDTMKRRGMLHGMPQMPYTPGYDFFGTIAKVGDGVTGFSEGEMVGAFSLNGGNTDFICVRASLLVKVPEGVDSFDAAAVILNYVTANQLLHKVAKIKKGERILIHGAAGGVGSALLQLGKIAGLKMYATASLGKHPLVRELGGEPIDYKSVDFTARIHELAEDGLDAVFDPVGGANLRRSYSVLRKGGRLVAYGVSSAVDGGTFSMLQTIFLSFLYRLFKRGKSFHFYSITSSKFSSIENVKEDMTKIFTLLSENKIKPVIGARLKLEEAAKAHEMIDNSAVAGKIILLSASEEPPAKPLAQSSST